MDETAAGKNGSADNSASISATTHRQPERQTTSALDNHQHQQFQQQPNHLLHNLNTSPSSSFSPAIGSHARAVVPTANANIPTSQLSPQDPHPRHLSLAATSSIPLFGSAGNSANIDPSLVPQQHDAAAAQDGPRQIRKRNRKALSCKPCRNMKVKCDRSMPCDRCLKNNRVNDCTYDGEPDSKKVCLSGSDEVDGVPKTMEETVLGKNLPLPSPSSKNKSPGLPLESGSHVRKVGTAITLYKGGKARYVGGSHWIHLFSEPIV
ncbi:hypothetical protein ABW19_dt0209697 [Dactylella cylindrospora]|nr:hypothetical protein ABW19_dt0209697 [Dactylella cylindrospora]